jgi:cobyric acid synthase
MLLGTGSEVGKSVLVAGFCRAMAALAYQARLF